MLIAVSVPPWYERYRVNTLRLPVCRRAMRTACSLASAPPLVKNTRFSSPGVRSAISRAASERASFACCGATVHSFGGLLLNCRHHLGVLVADIGEHQLRGEVQQAISFAVPDVDPSAATIVIGAISAWADHEWNTCALSSS